MADRGSAFLVCVCVALLATLAGPSARAGQAGFRKLTTAQIRAAFSGHSLSDGSHFSWIYRADGSMAGKSLGKPLTGQWRATGNRLCQTIERIETCSDIGRQGDDIVMTEPDADVSIFGRLETGSARRNQ